MSCLHATASFISNVHLAPDGTCAVTELPEDVAAEPMAAEFGAGTFFRLVPALSKLGQMFGQEGVTLQEFIDQLKLIYAIFRGETVEAAMAEAINFGTFFKFLPLAIEIWNMFKGEGGSFADILTKLMDLLKGLKPA